MTVPADTDENNYGITQIEITIRDRNNISPGTEVEPNIIYAAHWAGQNFICSGRGDQDNNICTGHSGHVN